MRGLAGFQLFMLLGTNCLSPNLNRSFHYHRQPLTTAFLAYQNLSKTCLRRILDLFVSIPIVSQYLGDMADPLSAIASAASIAGLADVSCRLAGSLYRSFRAVKEDLGTLRGSQKDYYSFTACCKELIIS